MRRSLRGAALLIAASAAIASGPVLPAVAQDDPAASPICVLTADEMTDVLGIPIARVAAAGLECAYSADPAVRPVQVLLAILPPDPNAVEPTEDGLVGPRQDHADGTDATIAGLPAWVAGEGTWVDVGDDVLAVWVNALFDADPPALPDTARAIAEAVVPRYVAAPRPSPTPRSAATGIGPRFPETLNDEPLDVDIEAGPDLFAQLRMFALGDTPQGLDELQAAIEATGVTLDQVEGGMVTIFDFDAGVSLTATGILIPGQDAGLLLDQGMAAFVDFSGGTPETVSLAGRDVVHVAEPPGGLDGNWWLLADGDVLWALYGDQVLAEAFLAALPPAGGAG